MNALIARIYLPWTISRVIFVILGGIIMTQAILDHLWLGTIFGGYFIAMGLFAWGCAGGNCTVPMQNNKNKQ